MIITVTMNPAIDRTAYIDWIREGDINRIGHVETDAGGKGINVSRMLRILDCPSVAIGLVGGDTGRLLQKMLQGIGMQTDFLEVAGSTRINEKIVEQSGRMTEFNEPGPLLTAEELDAFRSKILSYAKEGNIFVFSGSVPRGVDTYFYKEMIRAVHARGAAALLDADSSSFKIGMEAHPDIIKPNQREVLTYFGLSPKHEIQEDELLELCLRLEALNQKRFAISLGAEGAIFCRDGELIRCPGLTIHAKSPVGAGDAMVAALACGWERHMSLEDTARLAMAASAGAATTQGTRPPEKSLIDKLRDQVELLQL